MATLKALEDHVILRNIFSKKCYLYNFLFVNKRWHEVALSLLLQRRKKLIYSKIDSVRESLEIYKECKSDILPNQQYFNSLYESKPDIHILLEFWRILTIIPNQLKEQILPDFLVLKHEVEEYIYQCFWDRNLSEYDDLDY